MEDEDKDGDGDDKTGGQTVGGVMSVFLRSTLDDIQLVLPLSSQLCEESTNSCELYTPQVKNELIPKINQQFCNIEDAYSFYNNYAFHAGFSVRINSSKTYKNGELSRKDYVCFKEGERRISKATTTRRRGLTREKCGAKLVVLRARSGEGFVVSNFVEGHSHPLTTPRKTHLCIWNSESPEEFDRRWEDIVTKSNLSDNEWLQSMYEIRDRWVPAYTKHIFSAHMTSSQKAEISHAFFKRYVSKENTILDFALRFERALSCIRHNELNLDHKDVNEKPILKTSSLMEKGMSEIYTQSIFYMFQGEIFQINAYVITLRHEDEHRCLWDVRRLDMEGSRSREVSVEKSSSLVSCSCKMFDFDGIPCRHMLAYFSRMQMMELPTKYILRRWTKSAKTSRVMDDLGSVEKEICDRSILVSRQGLFQIACNVIDNGVLDEEGTEVVSKHLLLAKDELAVLRSSREPRPASGMEMCMSHGSQHTFKEPVQVRANGCGKRLKGGKEKAVKKSRKCHGCGLTGQSHDKRNCPMLLSMYVYVSNFVHL
ncbi:hypothetical protein RHSIM_Rhsim06G0086700 [Rhododendron simsii]|uniref:Protein FAR1-RELATED SEQUENCE n=1 Tax=Rhododendron simsii TaxID=118357 RepID=A0A834H2Z4_RHOSS|nr:hypothetical protein RHSIM_Rhsim06G0086700 [Rhododendron simsii]